MEVTFGNKQEIRERQAPYLCCTANSVARCCREACFFAARLSLGLQTPCALAFSTESVVGKTTTVNQYSAMDRTTLRNCSKSTGLTM